MHNERESTPVSLLRCLSCFHRAPAPHLPSRGILWREALVQGAFLLMLLAAAFPGVFLRGEVTTPADILYQLPPWNAYAPEGWERPKNANMLDIVTAFHPFYAMGREALEGGEWPLWNPLELAGMPLLANCQSAVLYPFRLLHVFLDIHVANTVYVLLKLWLCGMTAYLCGRVLGLRRVGACLLSVAWMLNGYNVIYAHWPLPDVSAWLPIAFLGIELLLHRRYRRGIFALASGGGLMILAGHPESAFGIGFDLSVYLLLRLALEDRPARDVLRILLGCAAGWTLALLVSAAQWMPFAEYLLHSATYTERASEGCPLWIPAGGVVCFWAPRFFGTVPDGNFWGIDCSNRHWVYSGMLIWFGAVAVWLRPARPGHPRTREAALLVTALFGALLAFNLPTFRLLHSLPLLRAARPTCHVAFMLFALAFVGAGGIGEWLARPGKARRLAWVALPVLAVAGIIAFLWQLNASYMRMLGVEQYVYTQVIRAGLLAGACVGLLALRCFLHRGRVLGLLMIGLLAGDLLVVGRGQNPTLPRAMCYPETALTDFLRAQPPPCRVSVATATVVPGLVAAYGIEGWLGYDGLYPARIIHFLAGLGPDLWNAMEPVFAILYYLHDPRFPPDFPLDEGGRFTYVDTLDGIEVYRNTRAFPRAFLVGQIEVISDDRALFERMAGASYDPAAVVVTDRGPAEKLAPTVGELGDARVAGYGFNHVAISVDAKQKCALVLADAYYPGWHAYVDGAAAEIFPAYYAFRGVIVPEGRHTVTFRYEPLGFRAGLALSTITLAAGGLYAVLLIIRLRRAGPR